MGTEHLQAGEKHVTASHRAIAESDRCEAVEYAGECPEQYQKRERLRSNPTSASGDVVPQSTGRSSHR